MTDNDAPPPSHCFLRVSVAGQSSRTIVIRLFQDSSPKTCKNFVTLCSSPLKTSRSNPQPSYRGTEFHRIVESFMVQGGDFDKFDGTGGYCPLTGSTFADESLQHANNTHDRPGIVSMANRGPNTNGSQFFITLAAAQHLDKKHVCFGEVVKGTDAVQDMTTVEREGTKPISLQKIVILDCGVGKGQFEEGSSSDDENRRERKKKHKKKHKKKKKKHRRRDDDDDDSYDRQRRKKHKKSRKYDSSSSDSSSSEEYRRRKKKRRRRDSDSDDADIRRSKGR